MVCWVEEQVCASASNMLQPTAVLVLALILHLHSESPRGCWAAVWLTWISKVCVGLTMTLRMIGEIWSTSFPGPVHIDQCVLAWQVSQKTAYKPFFFILKWPKRSEAKLIEGLYKHGSQSVLQLWSVLNPFWQLSYLVLLLEALPLRALVPAWRKPGGEGETLGSGVPPSSQLPAIIVHRLNFLEDNTQPFQQEKHVSPARHQRERKQ